MRFWTRPSRSAAERQRAEIVRPSESGGAAARTAPASLAALLAGRVLRDGEVVLLVLKPSLWFIIFQCIPVAAAALLVVLAVRIFGQRLSPRTPHFVVEAAIFVVAGRVMWAICQWMGRHYILTDQRLVTVSGVFNIELFDCPLRKIARTRVVRSLKEYLCRVGSIVIHPRDDAMPGQWQTIRNPLLVHETIVAAINRAGPCAGG